MQVCLSGLLELHKTYTVVKTAFSVFPGTYTGLHELHRTYTVEKRCFPHLPWHLNRLARASQHLHSGYNGFVRPSRLIWARKDRESNSHNCGGAVKLVQTCLKIRKDRESSFHHCVCAE